MRLPGTARVGILALCLGPVVFGGVRNWVSGWTLAPLDIPVTLAPGHIRTGDFEINVEALFSVQITFPHRSAPGCGEGSGLRTRRLTSIGGQAFWAPEERGTSSGITSGRFLGFFRSKPGRYSLDIEVVSATQYLNACHPTLLIEASSFDFEKWDSIQGYSFWFCIFCDYLEWRCCLFSPARDSGREPSRNPD